MDLVKGAPGASTTQTLKSRSFPLISPPSLVLIRSSTRTSPAMQPHLDQSPCATRHRYARTASTTAPVNVGVFVCSLVLASLRGRPLFALPFFSDLNSTTRVLPRSSTKRLGRYGLDLSRIAAGTSRGRTPSTAATRPRSRAVRPDGLRRTSASAWEEDSADVSECESESESAASELKPAAARSGGPRDSPCASRARWMSAWISASFAYVTETRAAKDACSGAGTTRVVTRVVTPVGNTPPRVATRFAVAMPSG